MIPPELTISALRELAAEQAKEIERLRASLASVREAEHEYKRREHALSHALEEALRPLRWDTVATDISDPAKAIKEGILQPMGAVQTITDESMTFSPHSKDAVQDGLIFIIGKQIVDKCGIYHTHDKKSRCHTFSVQAIVGLRKQDHDHPNRI